jgi:hypothetical protein
MIILWVYCDAPCSDPDEGRAGWFCPGFARSKAYGFPMGIFHSIGESMGKYSIEMYRDV